MAHLIFPQQKRHLEPTASYKSFDYLHDHRPEHMQFVHPVGVAVSRFNKGFMRRQLNTIKPAEDREKLEKYHQIKRHNTDQIRKGAIAKHDASHVMHVDESKMHEHSTCINWIPGKRIVQHRPTGEDDAFDGRFNKKRIEIKAKKIAEVNERFRSLCHSSILGVGRANLASNGVKDNFDSMEHKEAYEPLKYKYNSSLAPASSPNRPISPPTSKLAQANKLKNNVSSIFNISNDSSYMRPTNSVKTSSQIGFLFGADEKW